MLAVDVSLLTVVDADFQHVIAQHGLPGTDPVPTRVPVSHSLCRLVVERDGPVVLPDLAADPALAAHPAATDFGVAAYAGVPVRDLDGQALGALCVLERTPREWTDDDLRQLEALAEVVEDRIELTSRRLQDHGHVAPAPDADEDAGAAPRELVAAVAAGQLVLHYQPIVDLRDGTVAAYEALLRWDDPVRGLVPPLMFLPLAERIGLMPRLTRLVLRAACEQAAAWAAAGHGVPVSVNASPEELLDSAYPELVAEALEEFALDPGLLVIEVTEATTASGLEVLASRVATLRDLGVRAALDDFGTGQSDLARATTLPLGMLKIDRRFLADVPHDDRACSIVEVVVSLGRALDVRVTAEGIETAAQRDAVRARGCDYGQGWFFGRPAPACPGPHLVRVS